MLRALFKGGPTGLTVPSEIQILCVTFDTASRIPDSYSSYTVHMSFSAYFEFHVHRVHDLSIHIHEFMDISYS